jgi:hypothetical protein
VRLPEGAPHENQALKRKSFKGDFVVQMAHTLCSQQVCFSRIHGGLTQVITAVVGRSRQITVAERSKACTVFARSEAGNVGSNPTQGMDV